MRPYDPETGEGETWFYPDGILKAKCPECGCDLKWGTLYDWPCFLGSEPIDIIVRCGSHEHEWSGDEYPANFLTPDGKWFDGVRTEKPHKE